MPLLICFAPLEQPPQQSCCGAETKTFKSFNDAFVAVQACAASIGCLLVKNGCLSSQRMPSKWVELPFDPDTMTDDHNWPKLTQRLRCDRMHGQDFERTRNVDGHCSQSAAKRPKCGNKGVCVDATALLQHLSRLVAPLPRIPMSGYLGVHYLLGHLGVCLRTHLSMHLSVCLSSHISLH
jgi:hypothetical protein